MACEAISDYILIEINFRVLRFRPVKSPYELNSSSLTRKKSGLGWRREEMQEFMEKANRLY